MAAACTSARATSATRWKRGHAGARLDGFLLPWQWVLHNWALGLSRSAPLNLEFNNIADEATST